MLTATAFGEGQQVLKKL